MVGASRRALLTLAVVAATVALVVPGATASATTVDRGPFPTTAGFVAQQFPDFLARAATPAEVASWSAKVDGGQAAGTVVDGIRHLAGGLDRFGPVARLYSAYLLRTPDVGGLTYWLGKYRGGRSLSWISSSFAASSEFRTRYGSLSNKDFVLLIYRNVLQRSPDAGGVAFWTKKLNGGTSRGQVMLNFSESSEYKRKTTTGIDVLEAYVGLLHRAPTSSEDGDGVALVSSAGFVALAQQLLAGDDYRHRFGFTSTFIPVAGGSDGYSPLGMTVVSADGAYAYSTNRYLNEVEVTDIAARTLVASIEVGSEPYGIDFSPDGTKLYVANSGAQNVSVVDVASRTELRRVTIPPHPWGSDRPMTIAVANNGLALIGTTFDGSGYGGRLLQMDLATETITATGVGVNQATTEITPMRASGDRSRIYFALGDESGGRVFVYDAATKTATTKSFQTFIDGVAVNQDGSVAVYDAAIVTDPGLTIQGTIPGSYRQGAYMALTPSGAVGYRAESAADGNDASPGQIRYVDVTHFWVGSTLPLTDTVTTYKGGGLVALVPGKPLAVVQTDHGLSITELPTYS
jgi:YVTN family beta-propeller protein